MKSLANTTSTTAFANTIASPEKARISSRFHEKLQQLLWVESYLETFYTKAKKIATGMDLKSAISQLTLAIPQRKEQLEKAFRLVSANPGTERSEELIELTEDFDASTDTSDTAIRNAAIVFELQKITTFKIEQYSILCELAEEFATPNILTLPEKMLQAEICVDATLMDLSLEYMGMDEALEFIAEEEF